MTQNLFLILICVGYLSNHSDANGTDTRATANMEIPKQQTQSSSTDLCLVKPKKYRFRTSES